MSQAREMIVRCRAKLMRDRTRPMNAFYSALLLEFDGEKLIECNNWKGHPINTMATDGVRLFFNPDYTLSLSDAECIGVLVHECCHPIMKHHTRRNGRNPKLWNVAADLAINPIILADGYTLPKGALLNPDYAGLSAEEIYNRENPAPSPQKPENKPDTGEDDPDNESSPSEDGDSADGEDSDTGDSADGESNETADSEDGESTGAQGEDGEDDCQSDSANASGELPSEDGEDQSDDSNFGEILDAPDDIESDETKDGRNWESRVRQAMTVARRLNAGTLPEGLERLAREMSRPRVDWREQLREFVDDIARQDETWNRPNKRFAHSGLIIPGTCNDGIEHLGVLIDISGSIDGNAFAAFSGELVQAFSEGAAAKMSVAYTDTRLQAVDEFTEGMEVTLRPWQGGGTHFREAMTWAADQNFSAIIFFTDLATSDFGDDPGCPVLWAAWGTNRMLDLLEPNVPFGTVIRIA